MATTRTILILYTRRTTAPPSVGPVVTTIIFPALFRLLQPTTSFTQTHNHASNYLFEHSYNAYESKHPLASAAGVYSYNKQGCIKHPGYGFPGTKPTRCAAHRLDGMVDRKRNSKVRSSPSEHTENAATAAAAAVAVASAAAAKKIIVGIGEEIGRLTGGGGSSGSTTASGSAGIASSSIGNTIDRAADTITANNNVAAATTAAAIITSTSTTNSHNTNNAADGSAAAGRGVRLSPSPLWGGLGVATDEVTRAASAGEMALSPRVQSPFSLPGFGGRVGLIADGAAALTSAETRNFTREQGSGAGMSAAAAGSVPAHIPIVYRGSSSAPGSVGALVPGESPAGLVGPQLSVGLVGMGFNLASGVFSRFEGGGGDGGLGLSSVAGQGGEEIRRRNRRKRPLLTAHCEDEQCLKRPSYALSGTKPARCAFHKIAGDVYVRNQCVHAGCSKVCVFVCVCCELLCMHKESRGG